jgi:hypothetical protein
MRNSGKDVSLKYFIKMPFPELTGSIEKKLSWTKIDCRESFPLFKGLPARGREHTFSGSAFI